MSPVVTKDQFEQLNLLAGTAARLEAESLKQEDIDVWERDFKKLCDELASIVDAELGADLWGAKGFYDEAIKVAKGYFDAKVFGGLKAATGQFGFRLIGPQDLKTDAAGATPALYSWQQTLTLTSGRTKYTGGIGSAGGNAYVRNASNKKAVMAFHRLLSYKPSPNVILVEFTINDYPYTPYAVEAYSKVPKANKLFKIIPMPGRIILHPGGKFYANLYFDMATGATRPGVTPGDVDIEIACFGLIFAEHDYLDATELV